MAQRWQESAKRQTREESKRTASCRPQLLCRKKSPPRPRGPGAAGVCMETLLCSELILAAMLTGEGI